MSKQSIAFDIDDFHPGTSKPPHHRHFGDYAHDSQAKDPSDTPFGPTIMPSTSGSPGHKVNRWSLDMTEDSKSSRPDDVHHGQTETPQQPERRHLKKESSSEETSPHFQHIEMTSTTASVSHSPKHDTHESVLTMPPSAARTPRYERYNTYDEMLDNMDVADPFTGDYQPPDQHKLSKIPKRKKHKKRSSKNVLGEQGDAIPSSEPRDSKTKVDESEVKKMKKKKLKPASESLNSTATYTVEKGVVNPVYKADSRKNSGVKGADTYSFHSTGTYTLQSSDNDVEVNYGDSFRTGLKRKLKKITTVQISCKDMTTKTRLNEVRNKS